MVSIVLKRGLLYQTHKLVRVAVSRVLYNFTCNNLRMICGETLFCGPFEVGIPDGRNEVMALVIIGSNKGVSCSGQVPP